MFTASHNPAAYNGIKLCRSLRPPGRPATPGSPRSATWSPRARPPARPVGARSRSTTCWRRTPRTCSAWRPSPVAGSRSSSTPATRWPGLRPPRCSAGSGPTVVDLVPALLRARRHLPEPRRQPARPIHAGRPAGPGGRRGRRRRAGLRRRRGPLLPGRRDAVRSSRRPRSPALIASRELAKEPGATIIHNLITSRAVAEIVTRARRHPGPHQGGPLRDQGPDGRDERDLRRRALRPLLLPRLLARRLRHARGAARARRARGAGAPALGADGGLRPVRRQRRDQQRGAPTAGVVVDRIRSPLRRPSRRRARRAGRALAGRTPTGASTSAPPTPNHSSASTPRGRTAPPWSASATTCCP